MKVGDRIKRIPIVKIRPIRGVFDSDWDGVPNDQDCVWWDRSKQDFVRISEKRKKQLKKVGRRVYWSAKETAKFAPFAIGAAGAAAVGHPEVAEPLLYGQVPYAIGYTSYPWLHMSRKKTE